MKWTVEQLKDARDDLRRHWVFVGPRISSGYQGTPLEVEAALQTMILAGIGPTEFAKKVAEWNKKHEEWAERQRKESVVRAIPVEKPRGSTSILPSWWRG